MPIIPVGSAFTLGDLAVSGKTFGAAGAGYLYGNVLTATVSGRLRRARWYTASVSGAAQVFAPVLYSVPGGGSPVGGTLLAQGPAVSSGTSTTPSWFDLPYTSPVRVQAGVQYLLGLLSGAANSAAGQYTGSTGPNNFYVVNAGGNTTPDTTWGTGGGFQAGLYACGGYVDPQPSVTPMAMLVRSSSF